MLHQDIHANLVVVLFCLMVSKLHCRQGYLLRCHVGPPLSACNSAAIEVSGDCNVHVVIGDLGVVKSVASPLSQLDASLVGTEGHASDLMERRWVKTRWRSTRTMY